MAKEKIFRKVADDSDRAPGRDSGGHDGIAGPQHSICARAIETINLALPFLDSLSVLSGDSAPKDVKALKGVIRSELAELIGELSIGRGPRLARVEQIFSLILDQLGALQDGIEDERNLSGFGVFADYIASLFRSWNNIQQLFAAQTAIVTKQLQLVSDAVDEVRFAMDAVSLELEKRQLMTIRYASAGIEFSPVTVEDMLAHVQEFASSEGRAAITESGGFALRGSIAPEARRLRRLVSACMDSRNIASAPKTFASPPLQRTIRNLAGQLDELAWNC